jgi:hypothetical protein
MPSGRSLLLHLFQLQTEVGGGLGVLGGGSLQQLLALHQPGQEAGVEAAVGQQAQQGGREPQGDAGVLAAVGGGGLQHGQQGQVALLQGLEVPVFLQGAGLAGAHIGQVGVQHQGQVTGAGEGFGAGLPGGGWGWLAARGLGVDHQRPPGLGLWRGRLSNRPDPLESIVWPLLVGHCFIGPARAAGPPRRLQWG